MLPAKTTKETGEPARSTYVPLSNRSQSPDGDTRLTKKARRLRHSKLAFSLVVASSIISMEQLGVIGKSVGTEEDGQTSTIDDKITDDPLHRLFSQKDPDLDFKP